MSLLLRNPKFWLAGFLLWMATLWVLSSFSLATRLNAPINHFDKIAHFGYFFGGSGLLSAYLFLRRPTRPNWTAIIGGVVLAIALVGCVDEYHQSFTPGRSGNDLYDLMADVLGATVGAFTFKRFHHRLK